MGYTHYWWRPEKLAKETFENFKADVEKIMEVSGVALDSEITEDLIAFNSIHEPCETFYIVREVNEGNTYIQRLPENPERVFGFTKTRAGDYDVPVMASLIALKYWFPKSRISSDGGSSDWKEGVELYEKALDRKIDFTDFPGPWRSREDE